MSRCGAAARACGRVALCLAAVPGVLAAQVRDTAQTLPSVRVESTRLRAIPPVQCRGETITGIDIDPRPPFVRGVLDRWQLLSRAVSGLHVTTKPEIVRSFLALEEGEPCTELRRSESERILRAQPFLAAAVIRPIPDGPGQVRLLVHTVDELTIIASARASTSSPNLRQLRAGEGNIMGLGISAAGEWQSGTYGRDVLAARFVDYQVLDRPYQLELEGRRGQIGSWWRGSVTHPYFTDLQRVAWRASGGAGEELFGLRRPNAEGPDLAVPTTTVHADLAAVTRVGLPGRLSLFGVGLTAERTRVDPVPLLLSDSGVAEAPDSLRLPGRYQSVESTRVNALWGVRNIAFLPVEGFDALTAVQDVRVGFQAGALFGRSLAVLGSRDDDLFIATDIYLGGGTATSFLTVEARGEGRQNYDTNRWDGVLGSARAAWYLHAAPQQTLQTTIEWAGGWRARTPFQLQLGDRLGGVRGYADSDVAGGQRAVVRTESRWALGQYRDIGEYGLALFADAGRTWMGDVPFGEDSPVKVGVGLGVLAAVPVGSQRLWRLEVAYPVSPDRRAGLELRVSTSNLARHGWREPTDVERSRRRTVPEGLFNWP